MAEDNKLGKCACGFSILRHIEDVNNAIELINTGDKEEAFNKINQIKDDLNFIKEKCGIEVHSAEHKVGVAKEELERFNRFNTKKWLLFSTDEIYNAIKKCFHGWD